ncbi:DNA-directed RNA polymerase IV subunit 1 isoform X1 [Ananas comosus]|uniref:DNA-directed RNA polymerase n=2 Tax=Ananas comosus TaxID=4615 RepID=A0A6P5ELP8_ANACO|nr:DNA-directed RNA polymerase IV subunit 1 isoform X1 [Ananas comosus]XP_020084501.1 DNA-directed RNA polymerase IV subunit 1 isoform X1 [Ananas comosus]
MADEQIGEQAVPSGILTGLKFDLMTGDDIEKLSNASIVEANDLTNAKLGLPNALSQCATCGSKNLRGCDGHFGAIKLPAIIYHPYFVGEIVQILNQICPGCLSVKQDQEAKGSSMLEATEKFVESDLLILKALEKNLGGLQKKLLKICKSKLLLSGILARGSKVRICYLKKRVKFRKRWARTDKQSSCKFCASTPNNRYPSVRFKISSKDMVGKRNLSIVAEVNEKLPKKFQNKSMDEVLPQDYWDFIPMDQQQRQLKTSRITLSPHQAFHLLKQLDPEFLKQFVPRRELLFLSSLPVTANSHRAMETSHPHADGPQLSFRDERTKAYKKVVEVSRRIDEFRQHPQFRAFASSYVSNRVMDCLNASKLHSSTSNGEPISSGVSGLKWLKEVILSKRSDYAFRLVMVGDPKIKLDEIGIPLSLAENLLISDHVNSYNLEKLNTSCNLHLLNKEELHARRDGQLISVRKPDQLQIGDIFYRPLENGDLILINRPPSVHQHSLIALSVKVLPIHFAISINPLCCAPLLGDFDGDCLHGYIPQSIPSRVELRELVGLDQQLLNSQDGRSLVSLSHDSLVAAYLLTGTDVFLSKYEMQHLEMLCPSHMPFPSIIKYPNFGSPLWTGQQLFGMLLPPGIDFSVDSKKLHIIDGEVLSSPQMSFWLQSSTSSIFSTMFKSYGRRALDFLCSAQELLCEYLTMRGLSVSLSDLYLASDFYSRTKMTEEVNFGLDEAEDACRVKQLLLDPRIEFLLSSLDECEDSSYSVSHYHFLSNNLQIRKASIAAFKDVFSDIQRTVYHYVSKDNSMLSMIQSGSKGSLSKLAQQSLCLGLQLSASTFPFRIPQQLSCSWWNKQKALECGDQDAIRCEERRNFYAVIRSSFLQGLNPLECFLHAISGRANFFGENAEIPGTLTRKLSFYLRDLYVAYDGTVRSAYGQQIVQFSYDISDEIFHEDAHSRIISNDHIVEKYNGLGAPVGSWAASSISEAAYGGLEHPVNSLEDSPLMKLKEILECGKRRTYGDHAGILVLSKGLQRYRYGFEYGALEVKNHLEITLFSEMVNTVMILYECPLQRRKISPWSTHFHISKETLKKKRLQVQRVIDKLMENYSLMREKSAGVLPALCITKKNCPLLDEHDELDQTVCIAVAAEVLDSVTQLDTIKDVVILILLNTLVKGFLGIKHVEIQCQPDSTELSLKVTMSESCSRGRFWSTLQDACIPIMDLIDWNSSHPESIYDTFTVYGIDAAWKYFLKSLKSATSGIGRHIHQEQLVTVADCFSVTGEFHGLSTKGLKQQRNRLSISSPFSHACFSSPGNNFINAAKKGSVDELCGILDAVSWGKEPPVGTGGPFEIIFSQKVPQLQKSESIYKVLHNLKVEEPKPESAVACRASNRSNSKWRLNIPTFANGHAGKKDKWKCNFNKGATQTEGRPKKLAVQSEFLMRKVGSWASIVDMCTSLRAMLHEYPYDGIVGEKDKSSLMEALKYHPKRDEKIGVGVQDIKIGHHPTHRCSRCFILVRKDGTMDDFSYRKCVVGAAKMLSTEFGSIVEKKLYHTL